MPPPVKHGNGFPRSPSQTLYIFPFFPLLLCFLSRSPFRADLSLCFPYARLGLYHVVVTFHCLFPHEPTLIIVSPQAFFFLYRDIFLLTSIGLTFAELAPPLSPFSGLHRPVLLSIFCIQTYPQKPERLALFPVPISYLAKVYPFLLFPIPPAICPLRCPACNSFPRSLIP